MDQELFMMDAITLEMNPLHLQFNIDGVPLFKSSNKALWPILFTIKQCSLQEPMAVGIYCGDSKV